MVKKLPTLLSSGPSPWLRGSVVKSRKRGQTVILALAILFLLVLLGSIFVTNLIRNLTRVARQSSTDEALSLALAGIQYAGQQFRASEEGSDWRPRTAEALWRSPELTNATVRANRLLDPDFQWLSDNDTYRNPYTRVATGRGRFLLRVTYLPQFRNASDTSTGPDEFDPASRLVHIEVIGRPGDIDSNDPTTLRDPANVDSPNQIVGPWRKVEAFVPVGLVDQLWWVTNFTNERGPATLGVPPFRDGNGQLVEHNSFYSGGGIRSDMDLQLHGRVTIRVYPARSEGVFVKGRVLVAGRGNQSTTTPTPQIVVQVADDNGQATTAFSPAVGVIPPDNQDDDPTNDNLIVADNATTPGSVEGPSGQLLNPIPLVNTGRAGRYVVRDEAFTRNASNNPSLLAALTPAAQSTRIQEAPQLDQVDPTSGVNRWLKLTRDSGLQMVIDDNGTTRVVNTGAHGLTDETPPNGASGTLTQAQWERFRAKGLYLDNYGDIQYPTDRAKVKNEWMRRGGITQANKSWVGDFYIPSVDEGGVNHPIADVLLTRVPKVDSNGNPVTPLVLRPVIRVTRYDLDQRQMNLSGATGRQRIIYRVGQLDPATGQTTMVPVGQVRDYDYPPNGVFYAEGSIRVRGVNGMNYDDTNPSSFPKALTIVSGGSIYIDGNLMNNRNPGETNSAWKLALLARDYVTLNPTAFTRVSPGSGVVVEANTWDASGNASSYHLSIPQGGSLDFSASSANPLNNAVLAVKHSALQLDSTSETAVNLYLPRIGNGNPQPWPDWYTDRYDFGGYPPPYPGAPPGAPQQLFYLFRPLFAGTPPTWAVSNFQSVAGSPANWERKGFFIPSLNSPAGHEPTFRLHVGPQDGTDVDGDGLNDPVMTPNGQPYWLARAALLPFGEPLKIRVEAVIYAQTGSWFVIPPPFFNDDPNDTEAQFVANGNQRPASTQPTTATNPLEARMSYPFYNEPLNIEIDVVGSISENIPATPSEQAAWTGRLWLDNGYDPSVIGANPAPLYRPSIRYLYDGSLRRMVRARKVRTGEEIITWVAPIAPGMTGVTSLATAIQEAIDPSTIGATPAWRTNEPSYVETLPLFPRLPASAVIYEGNPL